MARAQGVVTPSETSYATVKYSPHFASATPAVPDGTNECWYFAGVRTMNFSIDTKGKSLFLALSAVSLISLMAVTALLWWFISPRVDEISSILATIILFALVVFFLLVTIGIIILFAVCYGKHSIRPSHKLIRFSINVLFQVNVFLGQLLLISKDRVEESFIHVNNAFLKVGKQKFRAEETLILLPHCLQNYDCVHRVVNNIDNCTECGKCVIMEFKNISKKCAVKIVVVPGGTLARKTIAETRPKCIVAVACHRDMVDGLLETFPLPGYGVLNERPHGPCINTNVDVGKIKGFLKHFVIDIPPGSFSSELVSDQD